MHQLELTDSQVYLLRDQVRLTKDAHVLRRALALLELYRGRTPLEVMALLQVSLRTVYRWIEELNLGMLQVAAGPQDIKDIMHIDKGRPPLWEEDLEEELEALFSYSPIQIGYPRTEWTLPLLRFHFKRWIGEDISISSLRRRLHSMGYRWKRTRYVLKPDPLFNEKVVEIQGKLKNLTDRDALLCLDETDLLLFPPLRSAWSMRGETKEVTISGWNEKRVIYGAMHTDSGNLLLMVRDRHQTSDFQAFLRLISNHYRGWHPILLMDEHPSHKSIASEALMRTLGMEVWWLPKRSPQLNPVDSIWGKAKDALLANFQYEDIDEQADQFVSILSDVPPALIRRIAGLESGNHWLRKN
jgi:transposase